MKKVWYDGVLLNTRTKAMIERLEARLGYKLDLTQGSYSSDVGASAGTHSGGGAVDISARGLTEQQKNDIVYQARSVGFAMWRRRTSQGPWPEHFHGIAIGDPEMSISARAQVIDYYRGKNGLKNHAKDDGPRLHPIPTFRPLPVISLGRMQNQFTTKRPRAVIGVKRVQELLNRRSHERLLVDGVAGPKTRMAYKRWEEKIDAPGNDGIPGPFSLAKLVSGFYRMV